MSAEKNVINVKEKKYYSNDPANVSMIGRITNFEKEEEPFYFCGLRFERDNKNLKIYRDLKDQERILIFKDKELWNVISSYYYDQSFKLIEEWTGKPNIFVNKNKNEPILIACDDFGCVVAPRVDVEDID